MNTDAEEGTAFEIQTKGLEGLNWERWTLMWTPGFRHRIVNIGEVEPTIISSFPLQFLLIFFASL